MLECCEKKLQLYDNQLWEISEFKQDKFNYIIYANIY